MVLRFGSCGSMSGVGSAVFFAVHRVGRFLAVRFRLPVCGSIRGLPASAFDIWALPKFGQVGSMHRSSEHNDGGSRGLSVAARLSFVLLPTPRKVQCTHGWYSSESMLMAMIGIKHR